MSLGTHSSRTKQRLWRLQDPPTGVERAKAPNSPNRNGGPRNVQISGNIASFLALSAVRGDLFRGVASWAGDSDVGVMRTWSWCVCGKLAAVAVRL